MGFFSIKLIHLAASLVRAIPDEYHLYQLKTVLVSRGLGAGIVQHFLVLGYKVATFSRNSTSKADNWQRDYPGHFYFETLSLTGLGSSDPSITLYPRKQETLSTKVPRYLLVNGWWVRLP